MLPLVNRGNVVRVNRSNGFFKVAYDSRSHWVQKAPYNLPSSYFSIQGSLQCSHYSGYTHYGSPYHEADTLYNAYFDSNVQNRLLSKAYDKVKSKLYTQASLGVDFAEAHQSINMIASTCKTLIGVTRSLRKLDFLGAAKALRMKFIPKGVSARKSMANNWLEYHFGWSPLISDIHDACEVLNNPIQSFNIEHGSASEVNHYPSYYNFGATIRIADAFTKNTVRLGGRVSALTNSTFHSLDQFGVANPLSIAWELVPFSFVVDWFANVGQVLASYSDFAGMTLDRTYTSKIIRTMEIGKCTNAPGQPHTLEDFFWSGNGSWFTRSLGLESPSLSIKSLKLPSQARAATAISLLIQQLSK